MHLFGYRTIFLVLIIEITVFVTIFILRGLWQIGIPFLIADLALFGIVRVDSKQIIFYSLSFLFSKKQSILLGEINEVIIEGRQGMTPGRLDIKVVLKDKNTTSGFILMYPFEKKRLVYLLKGKNINILY